MKHVILSVIFYHSKLNGNTLLSASTREENDKIKTLNLLISYVAYSIYKYKLLCRLDSLSKKH